MAKQLTGYMPPDADIETILADPGGACPDCVRIVIEGLRAEVKRLCKELDHLAEQVKRVREMHSAQPLYEECGHRHEKPDADLGVKDVRAVGLVCEDGYDYTVCRACCCDPDGDQSRECAENHDRECWPCPTIRILDGSEAGR